MQINFLTYLRKSYTLGRWLGMVVYVTLEILRVGPPQKAWAQTKAWTHIPNRLEFFHIPARHPDQGTLAHLVLVLRCYLAVTAYVQGNAMGRFGRLL